MRFCCPSLLRRPQPFKRPPLLSPSLPPKPPSRLPAPARQVVNCVGLLNYKFFLQFLAYTLLAAALAVALMFKPMLDFLGGRDMSG